MAELYVRHSLSTSVAVKFNVSLRQYVVKGEEGDQKWVMEVGTTHPAADGSRIPYKTIYKLTTSEIEDEIEKAVSEMCSYIDWGVLDKDSDSPYVTDYNPTGNNTPIRSKVNITIEEDLPSAGINLSNMKVILNNGDVDFDITNEINVLGDPYKYELTWTPPNF